ncbi:MAG: hypothetical protein PF961_18945 [Planctomycetota bacterium]|nr:hypothetical protein [Planctomycetota bacterium]
MRSALAAGTLLTIGLALIGTAAFVDRRRHAVQVYPQTKQRAATTRDLAWDLPTGWRTEDTLGPALATLSAALTPPARAPCSITVVANGPGMVADNLARWRGQLNLSAQDPVVDLGQHSCALGTVQALKMVTADQGERGFLLGYLPIDDGPAGEQLITVKLSANSAGLATLETDFIDLLTSLRSLNGQP